MIKQSIINVHKSTDGKAILRFEVRLVREDNVCAVFHIEEGSAGQMASYWLAAERLLRNTPRPSVKSLTVDTGFEKE